MAGSPTSATASPPAVPTDPPPGAAAAGTARVRLAAAAPLAALLRGQHSDVAFAAGAAGERVPAHRLLLMAHSEVLAAMLQSPCEEAQQSIITLPDFDPNIVQAFLRLLYTGDLSIPAADLFSLLQLCHLYGVQPAVAAVAEAIAARITHSTAVQLFCFGTTYSPAIRDAAQAHIRQNPQEVIAAVLEPDNAALQLCPKGPLWELLSDSQLAVREEDVYAVVLRWARRHQRDGAPPLAELIGEVAGAVRWGAIGRERLREAWLSGNVAADVLLPALLGLQPCEPRERVAGDPWASGKLFRLKCSHSAAHQTYTWTLPLSPDSVVSPAVEVQGLGFSWESYHAEGGWVDLYLSAPPFTGPGAPPLVLCRVTAVNRLGQPWHCGRWARCLSRGPQTGPAPAPEWITTVGDSLETVDRLFGPRQDHLQVEIDLRVEGPCRLRALRTGGPKECYELSLPTIVLEEDTLYPCRLLGLSWHLELLSSGRLTTVVLAALSPLQKADAFEFTCLFRHPDRDAYTAETTRSAWLRAHPSGDHHCAVTYLWGELPARASFVWPTGEVVLRFIVQRL